MTFAYVSAATFWQQHVIAKRQNARPYLPFLKRQLTRADRARLHETGRDVAVRYVDTSGRPRVHGGPRLRSTQAYTRAFSHAVWLLHSKYTLKNHLKSCATFRRKFRTEGLSLASFLAADTWPEANMDAVSRFLARRAAKQAALDALAA